MSDLSNIKPSQRTIEIKHPGTGDLLGVRVPLVSLDDDRLVKVRRSIADERLQLERKNKGFNAEQIEANRLKMILASMTGWDWYNPTGKEGDEGFDPDAAATFKGETPEFKPVNVRAVLNELSWFGDQIMEALGETESFFKP